MAEQDIDILMVTYNRAAYTRLALTRLLETCDESMRVWLWHNGEDAETLQVVRGLADHPRVHTLHHSRENKKLREPTNWFFENAKGAYLSKVDDDCLVPSGWASTLRRAHVDEPRFGVLGCWRFPEEDFEPDIAARKIREFGGGHRIMQNCWVEGSGFLMKRECINQLGLMQPDQSFPQYCMQLAFKGRINGWYFPFLFQEHMDDPRSQYCELRTDEDLERNPPLMAQRWGVVSLAEWKRRFKGEAKYLQSAPADPRMWYGWRRALRIGWLKVKQRVKGYRKYRAVGFE